MAATTYRVDLADGQTFLMRADLTQAAAPLIVCWWPDEADDDDAWVVTPYQTADARHYPRRAAELCRDYCAGDDDHAEVVEIVDTEDGE